jgi:anion-transporting  ArsA/GET3 family ATPase
MLSPKATKRVADNCGTLGGAGRTCTSNSQDAARCLASSAVHLISVDPMGNLVPLAGEQDEVVGEVPPDTVGAA